MRKPTIAIVGPGRFGSALAKELFRGGYAITQVISRDNPASRKKAAALAKSIRARTGTVKASLLDADLVWFCVPDREIGKAASTLAKFWKGKLAFHSSGALTSDELDPLRVVGVSVASVHPLMTFVRDSSPSLIGVPFALEGETAAVKAARKIVRNLGGEPFSIRKQNKVAYHAWGAFTSPLLIALLSAAEDVAGLAGISAPEARKKMFPIIRQTIANYAVLGPEKALTGPLVRADVEVVRKHLSTLGKTPEAKSVYRALSDSVLSGSLVRNSKSLRKALKSRN